MKSLFIYAALTASAEFIAPRIIDLEPPWMLVSLLTLAWGSVLTFAIAEHGKQGLWLLVSAPLALYWPIWIAVFYLDPSLRP